MNIGKIAVFESLCHIEYIAFAPPRFMGLVASFSKPFKENIGIPDCVVPSADFVNDIQVVFVDLPYKFYGKHFIYLA